jgi:hypothetical protein
MWFTSTSFQGNLHEALIWVNSNDLMRTFLWQVVQQGSDTIGLVFRANREDTAALRKYLGQRPLGE